MRLAPGARVTNSRTASPVFSSGRPTQAHSATPAQAAVLAGLTESGESVQAMVAEFRARRDLVVKGLNRIPGLRCVPPAGAFYAFPRFAWPGSAQDVASTLLTRGLITTPGDAFGSLGSSHLRLSFATSRENLRKALALLRTYATEVHAA